MVYALALCRGDAAANANACAACVAAAFQDAQQLCAYAKDVAIYYDLCYPRFSNWDFLAGDSTCGRQVINVSAPTTAPFDAAVGALLNAVRDGRGGARRGRRPRGLRAGVVHAGHVAGQLPELPGECDPDGAQGFQREPDREVYRVRCN